MKKFWVSLLTLIFLITFNSFMSLGEELWDKISGLSYRERVDFLKPLLNEESYPMWKVAYYLGDSYFHLGDILGNTGEDLSKKKFYWEGALNYFTRYMWEEKRRANTYEEKLLFSKSFLEVAKIYSYYSNTEKAFRLIFGAERLGVLDKSEIEKVRKFATTNLFKFKTEEDIEKGLTPSYIPRGVRRKIELIIFFDYDSYKIKHSSYKQLDELAKALLSPGLNTLHILIAGHADKRGTKEYNLVLSERRAVSVKDYLVKKGVDEFRLSTKGYGFSRPIDPRDTEEAYRLNRRVEFIVIK